MDSLQNRFYLELVLNYQRKVSHSDLTNQQFELVP